MRGFARLLLASTVTLGLLAAGASTGLAKEGGNLVVFNSMTPVTGAAVGVPNDRGINGGGLAWAITSGTGTVSHKGAVDVTVTGLIIPARGGNPLAAFKVIVSCITPGGVVNLSTATATANTAGDSHITGNVDLPHPCQRPIVFVTSAGGAWFAMSNPQADDEDQDE